MSDETTNHPSITELLTATYHQDTVSDLLELAKIQARTIERLMTPRPSLMTNVSEWIPMILPLIHMLRPNADGGAPERSPEFVPADDHPMIIVDESRPAAPASAAGSASSAHARHDIA